MEDYHMRIYIFFSFFCTNTKSEVLHLKKYELSYFSKPFQDYCLELEIYSIFMFSKKTKKLKTLTCEFLFFLFKKLEKTEKREV